ncbi:hypothetical protein BN2475_820002 [Paraburkholderia ribeironis]|uniref:Uncharacterized protein n=2 Tax=Paraburkholderia ribeironis TaxID=1247936 RepID=A0A1N7SK34_9BURK|nr:hypothetical protein BN2475_820002 [Paraburkholderia ribeironis]
MGNLCAGGISSSNARHNVEVTPGGTPSSPRGAPETVTETETETVTVTETVTETDRMMAEIDRTLMRLNSDVDELIQRTAGVPELVAQRNAAIALQRRVMDRLGGNFSAGGPDNFERRINRISAQIDQYHNAVNRRDREQGEQARQLFAFEADPDNFSQPFHESARFAFPTSTSSGGYRSDSE